MILLNPGPVTLTKRVRDALAGPDLCHREPEFATLQAKVRAGLTGVYALDEATWATVLVSGSGTAAVEAMLISLVPGDGHLVTVENGVYGERLTRIARAHGIPVTPVRVEWGDTVDPDEVDAALASSAGPTAVAMVHHETTTGRLNEIEAIGERCRARGARLLLDGVSSFAGEAIEFERWGVDACAATANKCLHGAPGMAFVVCRRGLLDAPGRSVYLDLRGHLEAQEAHSTAFTPAVPALYSLAAALEELAEQGGWSRRHARYLEISEAVGTMLEAHGVRPWLAPGASSAVLRSYALPDGMDYATLHDELKARGFIIYAGQGELSRKLFRISPMGAIGDSDLARLQRAFDEILS